jgi:anti-anti-sigma regulatory factor
MREIGGEVKLAAVPGFVAQVLALTRLDKVFEMYPDVAQARLSFRPTS